MTGHNKTNPVVNALIKDLRKKSWENKAPIWKDIARRFEKPLRNWSEVNVSHIARVVKSNEIIIVPGKLLGTGNIDIPVTVAAFSASEAAKVKITKAGGKIISIRDLMNSNPKGKGVRIIG